MESVEEAEWLGLLTPPSRKDKVTDILGGKFFVFITLFFGYRLSPTHVAVN